MSRKEKEDLIVNILGITILALIIIVPVAVSVWWHDHIYDDWTCAFTECRRIK